MKKLWKTTLLGLIFSFGVYGQLNDLMIVEYVDWDPGDGLAVKIYNPTSSPVNLSGYSIAVYNNGNTTPTYSVSLSGVLQPSDVLIAGNNGYPCTKSVTLGTGVNGNDAIALLKSGAFVDMINKVGASYGTSNGLFYHNRLVRKNSNCVRYTSTNGTSANSWPSTMIFSHSGWSATAPQCFSGTSPYTPQRDTVQNLLQLCQGDSVLIDNVYHDTSGTFYEIFTSADYCDSVVETVLTVLPTSKWNRNMSICGGDSVFLAGAWQKVTGVYSDTVTTGNGCDSVVETSLNVVPIPVYSDTLSVCSGDSAFIGGNWQTAAGLYSDTLSFGACDSIVNMYLRVLPGTGFSYKETICQGDSILLQNQWQKTPGIYNDTLIGTNGCDSIVATELEVLPMQQVNDSVSICAGDSVLIGGIWQKVPGLYLDTLQTAQGCDSIVSTELIVNALLSESRTVQLCRGDSIFLAGAWQYSTGTYMDTLPAVNGCDSLLFTYLEISDALPGQNNITLCAGDSIWINGFMATGDTVFSYTKPNPNNCDSVITVEITTNKVEAGYSWYQDVNNNQQVTFNNTSSGNNFNTWFFGDGTSSHQIHPLHTYADPGTYTVRLIVENAGCADTTESEISIPADREIKVFIPNSFTPNGDNINDHFRISAPEDYPFQIQIFNRWGQRVFYAGTISFLWDGTYKGEGCPEGVYTYKVTGIIEETGIIHLIR